MNRNKKEEDKKKLKNTLCDKLHTKQGVLEEKQRKLEVMQKEMNEIKESSKHYKDQLIRMQADFENYKKREEKKKQEFVEYAKEGLICKLLSVIDNLERASTYAENQEEHTETIKEGIRRILKEFLEILGKEGLKPIKAVGEKFDPYCHEAIMQTESDKYPDDTVVEELSKGYYLKSKVVRPSVVKVCKNQKDECGEQPEDQDQKKNE